MLYEPLPEVTQRLVCKWVFEQRYNTLAEHRADRELRKAAVKREMEAAAEAEKVKQANKAQEVVTCYNVTIYKNKAEMEAAMNDMRTGDQVEFLKKQLRARFIFAPPRGGR